MNFDPSEFGTLLKSIHQGEILVPLIRNALWDPNFKTFSVQVGGEGYGARGPDGWFHPSTHPSWPERMLYWYLAEPTRFIGERLDPTSVLAVTQGKFWHSIIQRVGIEARILRDPGICPCGCEQREFFFADRETKTRGHTDGIVEEGVVGEPEVFEFKTMKSLRLQKIPLGEPTDPEVVEAFKKLAPDYVLQANEYMRMSGYRAWRAVIMSMEHPFPMREISLAYDPFLGREIKEKYMRVRQDVADGRMPPPCCGPGSKESKACGARLVCPMGQ